MSRMFGFSRRVPAAIALLACISGSACVDSAAASRPGLACKAPSAEERAEIADLIARYGPYFDYHEAEAWASLFTEDGELNYPKIGDPTGSRESVKGHDALAAFASQSVLPAFVLAHVPGRSMFVSEGPDRVKALTPVITVALKTDVQFAADYNGLGAYEDVIVRTPQGWRFQLRTATIYASGVLPPEFLPCPP